jgi:hypothetical protein
VRFARHRRLQVRARRADRQIGRRVAYLLQVFQVPVRVAGLALRGGAEQRRDVVLAFDVGLGGEIEIPPVRQALAGERGLEVIVGFGAFELHCLPPDGFAVSDSGAVRVTAPPRLIKSILTIHSIEFRYGVPAPPARR